MNRFIIQSSLIGLTLLAIFKNSFSTKPLQFTCKNYLLNAYLYIFLTLLLIFFITDIYYKTQISPLHKFIKYSTMRFLILIFLSLSVLLGVMVWSPKDLLGKHAIWLVWVSIMAYILYPLLLQNPTLFSHIKIITYTVMTVLTLFTFWKPHLISLSWGTTLFILLVGLIIIRLLGLLFPPLYSSKMSYILSYVSLVLFSFFMLWDTKLLIIKAKKCVNADYINDSLGVVLNGLNIFTNLFDIKSR